MTPWLSPVVASSLTPPPGIAQNDDLLVWFLGILLAGLTFSVTIIGWFLVRALRQNDETNRQQWKAIAKLMEDHSMTQRQLAIISSDHDRVFGGGKHQGMWPFHHDDRKDC
jgi:hypothetical protein